MLSRFNQEFAEWAGTVAEGLSLRQVEIRTGISYATVKGLLEGRNSNAETVMRFALGFKQEVPKALRLAGYGDLADAMDRGDMPTPAPEPDAPKETREPFFDELIEAGYQLPEAERPEVLEYLRFKAARAQSKGVIGKRAMTEDEEDADKKRTRAAKRGQ